jgi:antitoxin component YwqK of YwqJK toxin-antitoxin module
MKKSIFTLWLFSLFLSTNLTAQDCLPESRDNNPEFNKMVTKILKFYLMDNEIYMKSLNAKGKIKEKKQKVEYLRHSLIREMKAYTDGTGQQYKKGYVLIAVKGESGCSLVAFRLLQTSVGAGVYSDPEIYAMTTNDPAEVRDRQNPSIDCDCILKTTDWLNPGAKTTVTEKTTTTNKVTENSNQSSSNNTSSSNVSAKDASGLPAMDKKKPGYYVVPDGDRLSEEGYKIKNKLEGEYRSYTEGKLEYVYTMKNGKKEGPAAEYHENGKVKTSGMYKNDAKDGEWKKFTEAGKPAGTEVYVDGEKQ